MNTDEILEIERRQMRQIRELDMEELHVEEVDDDEDDDSDDHALARNDGGAGGFTYNTYLSSLHTYLGEVDDTHCRFSFLDGGAVLKLPMFHLQGVVLFPEATLPLKVVQPRFAAAVVKALTSVDAPCTIAVVRVYWCPNSGGHICSTGTTAEIRQYKRLADGSYNVVARGQQRFRLRRCWVDDDGTPWGEVQIIHEDSPQRMPKDVFGQLASISSNPTDLFSFSCPTMSNASVSKLHEHRYEASDSECTSSGSDLSMTNTREAFAATVSSDSPSGYNKSDGSSSDDDKFMHKRYLKKKRPLPDVHCGYDQSSKHLKSFVNKSLRMEELGFHEKCKRNILPNNTKRAFHAPMTFWPPWVYKMYDSHLLARKAADLWRDIIGKPNLDSYARQPDILSFHIASKLPLSEVTRQELLDTDGISYRLQKEIQLLQRFNLIRCRDCQTIIAKRSDIVAMSSDGSLNTFNTHGFVHAVITVHNASGLALLGSAVKEHSWFPGYAWTVANCAVCESNMGWLFTATKKNLLPKSVWGIRCSQISDDITK